MMGMGHIFGWELRLKSLGCFLDGLLGLNYFWPIPEDQIVKFSYVEMIPKTNPFVCKQTLGL